MARNWSRWGDENLALYDRMTTALRLNDDIPLRRFNISAASYSYLRYWNSYQSVLRRKSGNEAAATLNLTRTAECELEDGRVDGMNRSRVKSFLWMTVENT